jgi:hypothetical protein
MQVPAGRGLTRPQPEVRQDLRDDLGLFDERENPHGSGTARAGQRIHLVDLLDQASASSAERRAQARFAAEAEIEGGNPL